MTDKSDQIADLLRQTGLAHHQAFIETNGEDAEWASWYAGYLLERLPAILGKDFTSEQLTELLIGLDKQQNADAPDAEWPEFYANQMLSRYSSGA